ncbi:hypothetical protein BH23ACT10_BH23ACT10_06250 [soil metagenome]
MRTTIELTDESHEAISALARRQGLRGLSEVVQAAVDTYLSSLDARTTETVLGLEGAISQRSAAAMEDAMQRTRQSWR